MRKAAAVLVAAILAATAVSSPAHAAPGAVTPDGKPFTVGAKTVKPGWGDAGVKALKKVPARGGVTTQARTSCTSAPCYLWQGAYQNFTSPDLITIVGANVRVKKPYLEPTNDAYHSLQESTIQQGSGSTRDIIEVGWTVDPALNGGSLDPFLFTFAWVNGTPLGYNTSGGFVDNGSCSLNAGSSLAYDISNATPNSTWTIQWDGPSSPAADGWWIAYKDQTAGVNCYVGYWPQSLWSNAGKTFTSGTHQDNFTEIAAKRTEPCSDFGSGDPVATGQPAAAGFTSVTATAGSAATSLTGYTTPSVTNAVILGQAFIGTSVRSFLVGGRGWNAAGTGGGTKGSC
jgi:hypothetical protein